MHWFLVFSYKRNLWKVPDFKEGYLLGSVLSVVVGFCFLCTVHWRPGKLKYQLALGRGVQVKSQLLRSAPTTPHISRLDGFILSCQLINKFKTFLKTWSVIVNFLIWEGDNWAMDFFFLLLHIKFLWQYFLIEVSWTVY